VPDGLEVCVSFPSGTSKVGDPVRVTASVDYNWLPFLSSQALGGLASTTVSSSSTMRLEAPPTNYGAGCA